MLWIENTATRKSLKNAFDGIFARYGRKFEDDDEIDLTELAVVKRGHHLSMSETREFGSVYRSDQYRSEAFGHVYENAHAIPEEYDTIGEDVFITSAKSANVPVAPEQIMALRSHLLSHLEVYDPQESDPRLMIETQGKPRIRKKRDRTFDSILESICMAELEAIRRRPIKCHQSCSESCFECILNKCL